MYWQRLIKNQTLKDVIFAGVQHFIQQHLRIAVRQFQMVSNAGRQIVSLHEVHVHLQFVGLCVWFAALLRHFAAKP